MGSAAAEWLAAEGVSVVLIDRYPRGHTWGGSHGDSRIFRLAYSEYDYSRLAATSLPLWRALEEKWGSELLVRTGGIDHGPGVVSAIGGVLTRLGIAFEMVPARAAMDRWPGMRFDDDVVFQSDAGRLHADNALAALQGLAERRGAILQFESQAEITRLHDRGVIVTSEKGDIEAGVVVVAAGPWAPRLTPPDLQLPPLRVTHEEPGYFPPGQFSDRWPVFVHYGTSGVDSFAAYGLTVPGRGVKVGLHASGTVIDPDSRPRPRSREVGDRLARYVSAWLPGLEDRPTETVSCIYDSTPNDDFVVDRRGPVVVATGFSGHGFKFAPTIGRLAGRLARGEADAPARFRFRSG